MGILGSGSSTLDIASVLLHLPLRLFDCKHVADSKL